MLGVGCKECVEVQSAWPNVGRAHARVGTGLVTLVACPTHQGLALAILRNAQAVAENIEAAPVHYDPADNNELGP